MTGRRAAVRLVIRKRPDGRYDIKVPTLDGPARLGVPTWTTAVHRANLFQTNGNADLVPIGWTLGWAPAASNAHGVRLAYGYSWRCLLCSAITSKPGLHVTSCSGRPPVESPARVTYLRGGAR